jgi:hypothetical protein
MTDLNTAEQFLVRVHNGEDPSVDEFREQVPDLGLPWWQLIGFHGWHLAAVCILALILTVAIIALPSPNLLKLPVLLFPCPVIIVLCRYFMFSASNDDSADSHAAGGGSASWYYYWLILRRLQKKGIIDVRKMEPYETGDPSGLDIMQTFAPAAVLLPMPGLTVITESSERITPAELMRMIRWTGYLAWIIFFAFVIAGRYLDPAGSFDYPFGPSPDVPQTVGGACLLIAGIAFLIAVCLTFFPKKIRDLLDPSQNIGRSDHE